MSPSPQPDPQQSNLENMLGDPDFHHLEPPEQRQLLRDRGLRNRSDQELDSLVMAARNYHGMSSGQVMSPVTKFLGSAGQAFQALPYAGEGMLHMIGGPDPTTGETTADWFNQLPGVADYNRLRQGQIAEELGSLVPGAGLSLLTGGVARAPEIAEATGTGAGATWAGLKGAAKAYSTEKTLLPATLLGGALRHFDVPYGAEIGGFLGASPTIGKGFIQGVREYLNPPYKPTEFGPAPPRYGPQTSSTARFAEPLPEARTVVPPPPVTYPKQPITPAGRVVPPPPVTYRPTPEAGPVVPPPPVTYRAAPEGKPVVPPPPVTYRTIPEAGTKTGTGGTPPTYPRTSSTARFAEEESPESPIIIEGIGKVKKVKGEPMTPAGGGEPTDVGAEMNGFHAAVERLPGDNPYAPGGPSSSAAGQKAKGYTGGLMKALNIDPTSPLAARQFRALTNASYAAKRLLTTDEARAVIQNIK